MNHVIENKEVLIYISKKDFKLKKILQDKFPKAKIFTLPYLDIDKCLIVNSKDVIYKTLLKIGGA